MSMSLGCEQEVDNTLQILNAAGQNLLSGQVAQKGLRAVQVFRPWAISR